MYTLYSININKFDEKLKIHKFFKAKFDCKIKNSMLLQILQYIQSLLKC